MVARSDHHRVDFFVVEELPQILIAFGAGAEGLLCIVNFGLIGIANGGDLRTLNFGEGTHMLARTSTATDEPEPHFIIGQAVR